MGRNISLQEAGSRWVKNSLRSYLEGEKNLKWIAGILKGMTRIKFNLFLTHWVAREQPKERPSFWNGSIGPTLPARQNNALEGIIF